MWVWVKSCRALGITNKIASIRITHPKVHCSPVRAIFIRCSVISEPLLFVGGSLTEGPCFYLLQTVAGAGIEVKIVKPLQLLNAFERGCVKRRLAIEGMEDDALQQIAEGHVVVLGKGFQDFEQAFFHAHPGLDALDQ